jgi:SAM-dependent methyltransferase
MDAPGKFFDGFADVFDTFYDGKRTPLMQWIDQHYRRDMFLRYSMTFDFLGKDLRGKTVLDIGCGSGPYVAEALRRGADHVTGVDPAPRMLELTGERARKLNQEDRVTLVEGYFPNPKITEQYDYAIVMGVMDYVEDPAAFMRALGKVYRKGAVLSFPSTHWLRTPIRKVRYNLRRCPLWFYTAPQIEQLAREAAPDDVRLEKIAGAGMDYVLHLTKR